MYISLYNIAIDRNGVHVASFLTVTYEKGMSVNDINDTAGTPPDELDERPTGERLQMLLRVYATGPQSDAEAEEILADDILVKLLRRSWQRQPPTSELQRQFEATGPHSQRLLSLASSV